MQSDKNQTPYLQNQTLCESTAEKLSTLTLSRLEETRKRQVLVFAEPNSKKINADNYRRMRDKGCRFGS
ncbi:hypothetical protein AAC387_Pa03g1752 [Persea americana]